MSRGHGIMSAGYYTSAGSPSDRREDISLANRVHPPGAACSENMV